MLIFLNELSVYSSCLLMPIYSRLRFLINCNGNGELTIHIIFCFCNKLVNLILLGYDNVSKLFKKSWKDESDLIFFLKSISLFLTNNFINRKIHQ